MLSTGNSIFECDRLSQASRYWIQSLKLRRPRRCCLENHANTFGKYENLSLAQQLPNYIVVNGPIALLLSHRRLMGARSSCHHPQASNVLLLACFFAHCVRNRSGERNGHAVSAVLVSIQGVNEINHLFVSLGK